MSVQSLCVLAPRCHTLRYHMDEDFGWRRSGPHHEYAIVKAGTCALNMPIYNSVISTVLHTEAFLLMPLPLHVYLLATRDKCSEAFPVLPLSSTGVYISQSANHTLPTRWCTMRFCKLRVITSITLGPASRSKQHWRKIGRKSLGVFHSLVPRPSPAPFSWPHTWPLNHPEKQEKALYIF